MVYDVAIVGLGAMGSSSVFELSRRGQRVVGFDAFAPPHSRASSHGETRVIREAYFEDPLYVPLVQRAYELWHDLELRSGRTLLTTTGGLMLGLPDSSMVRGASASARTHHLAHEVLSAADIRRRYPAFRLPDSIVGVLEPRAGVLFPERCIDSYLTLAVSQGATLMVDEPVLEWEVSGDSVWLRTANQRYTAGRVVFCCGPWITTLVNLPISLQVERNVQHWYQPQARSSLFQPGALPIFLLEDDTGRVCYGLPELPEVGVLNSACGSSPMVPSATPTAPSATPQTQSGTGLLVTQISVSAMLERWSAVPWDISYSFCYSMASTSPEVANLTFRRVDYTTVGPTGAVYDAGSDSTLIGQPVGVGRLGCFFTYRDQNTTRPVATTYRMSFQYAANNSAEPTTQTVSGDIRSTVPPQPFITSVTLADDIRGVQKILRQPTPVTFTVSKVEGGTPPFLYQWRLNGVLLRDWDPNPVLIWDGATLGGGPTGSGGYTLAVSVRRSTWHEAESGASLNFLLIF